MFLCATVSPNTRKGLDKARHLGPKLARLAHLLVEAKRYYLFTLLKVANSADIGKASARAHIFVSTQTRCTSGEQSYLWKGILRASIGVTNPLSCRETSQTVYISATWSLTYRFMTCRQASCQETCIRYMNVSIIKRPVCRQNRQVSLENLRHVSIDVRAGDLTVFRWQIKSMSCGHTTQISCSGLVARSGLSSVENLWLRPLLPPFRSSKVFRVSLCLSQPFSQFTAEVGSFCHSWGDNAHDPLSISPWHIPFTYPLGISPSHIRFAYPLHISPLHVPFAYPLCMSPSRGVWPLVLSDQALPLHSRFLVNLGYAKEKWPTRHPNTKWRPQSLASFPWVRSSSRITATACLLNPREIIFRMTPCGSRHSKRRLVTTCSFSDRWTSPGTDEARSSGLQSRKTWTPLLEGALPRSARFIVPKRASGRL